MTRPEEFVMASLARPFRLGHSDCVTLVEAWIIERSGRSALGALGWDHATRFAEAATSPLRYALRVGRAMRRAGFRRTAKPQSGDVGLVVLNNRLVVAIRGASAWHGRAEGGLIGGRGPVLAAWRVE